MPEKRRHHSPDFKAKIAAEALRGVKTQNEIASEYGIHPMQVTAWKKQLLDGMPALFGAKPDKKRRRPGSPDRPTLPADRATQSRGRLAQKNLSGSVAERRAWIEAAHPSLSVAQQCALLGLARSTYYAPPACADESEENLEIMRWLDAQYTKTPYYGSPKMTVLLRQAGYTVNHKRVERLMAKTGLRAIAPGKATSVPAPGHAVYPYLLRGVSIQTVNHVWSADITYIRLRRGFVFLTAAIDWFSRFVLAWELSTTQDTDFCVRALEAALLQGRAQIFNTDQGSPFTSEAFTGRLKAADIPISMDGRGRALDNIFVERLWRTVKYEEVYLYDYETPQEARVRLSRYLRFYNEELIHQALQYRTPAAVFAAGQPQKGAV